MIFQTGSVFHGMVKFMNMIKFDIAADQSDLPVFIKRIFQTAAEAITEAVFVLMFGWIKTCFINVFARADCCNERKFIHR